MDDQQAVPFVMLALKLLPSFPLSPFFPTSSQEHSPITNPNKNKPEEFSLLWREKVIWLNRHEIPSK